MLPRKQRLSGRRVEYLLRKGRRRKNNYFISQYLPTTNLSSRFAVVVSTKVLPLATDRNRIRRQTYEAIRLNQNSLKKNHDIVLILKQPFVKLPYEEITKIITNFLAELL